tara:strand:+ start:661 stop:1038 length:378 start_codon:yes stop_codon:yes gene_type:complete
MLIFALLVTITPFCLADELAPNAHFCKHAKTVIKHLKECKDSKSCYESCNTIRTNDDLETIASSPAYELTGLHLFNFCKSIRNQQTPTNYKLIADDIEKAYQTKCLSSGVYKKRNDRKQNHKTAI